MGGIITRCCEPCRPRNVIRYCATCNAPDCQFRGICSWPHGCCFSFMAIMSAFGGVYFNVYTLGSCFMQRVHLINPVTGETIPGSERGYGFYSRETDYGLAPDYGQCSYYAEDEKDMVFDAWFNTSMVVTWISMILGTASFLVIFTTCMCAYSQSMFSRWLMWFYIIAAICMGLSFLVFGSEFCKENECTVAAGNGYALTCFMMWLSAANTIKSFGGAPPEAPPRDENAPRRPWFKRKKDPNQLISDEQQELADLYYEGEEDKYPIPEVTPDGRKRYSYFAALADDQDGRVKQEDEPDSSSDEDDSDDDSDDEDSDDDNEKQKKSAAGYQDQPNYNQSGGYSDQPQGGQSSDQTPQQGYYDDQGNYYDPNYSGYYDPQGNYHESDPNTTQYDPTAHGAEYQAAQEGVGYEGQQSKPAVGDPDGPTIT